MELPSIERLRMFFSYCPETGEITRKIHRSGIVQGKPVGSEHKGYRRVNFDGKLILCHRLAWAIHHGEWPKGEVDHINMNKSDNRICNLRDVNRSQNMVNRNYPKGKSGVTGVSTHKKGWQSVIRINKKSIYLGLFQTIEEAALARSVAEKIYYGSYLPKENSK